VPLENYRRKRRFSETPEPQGGKRKSRTGRSFVVQLHKARRLHYDFRLELEGTLKSWAIPKGPSLDPYEKRLAVHVEDHPIEYGEFEGVIPPGQYGSGTVVLWDSGEWKPVDDPQEGYRQGKLKFRLEGEKLRGGWTLVRMRGREGEKADNWLLIKERDEFARSLAEYDILEDRPESVASGKTAGQIAAAPERAWSKSGETAVPKKPAKKQSPRRSIVTGARKAGLPAQLKPQMATLAGEAPQGDQWLHEIKLDGYRLLLRVEKGKAKLITRNQLDWSHRFPELAAAAAELPLRQAMLDGEVVSLLPGGVSSFQSLQEALSSGETGKLVYYAFDLLHVDGQDLSALGLEKRKEQLAALLSDPHDNRIQYLDHIEGNGPEFFRQCCQMGLEGIISKRRDRPYREGRGPDWLKIKCVQKEELVIGGYTRPTAAGRTGLGALLVGYYNGEGELVYAGRVGTGFSEKTLVALRRRLNALEQAERPFHQMPPDRDPNIRWVRPELVAQVEFSNWTGDGLLRHPSFQGLREDKDPMTVTHNPGAESNTAGRKPKRTQAPAAASDPPDTRRVELSPEQLQQLGRIRLTNPDRVFYPEQGLTKLGLAMYYVQIAPWILPHLVDRPVSIVRCPEGHTQQCFFQKHAAAGTPEALARVAIREKENKRDYLVIRDLAGLVSVVQMGGLEMHPWGARTDNIERPDRVVFDLDPDPEVPWRKLVDAAHHVREFLEDLGLVSFLKTTGGKGLHLVVPIQRRHSWDDVKEFTQAVARHLANESPKLYVATASKQARKGKIYIDYLRNARGATAVAAYSTRARPGAPVSTPLSWDELSAAVAPDHFRVDNLPGRLASLQADPWAEIADVRQSITSKMKGKVGAKSP
jgi:bifunctional non-homologous end joining protein LigD